MSNEGVELGSQGGVGNTSEVEGSIEERVNTLTNEVSVLTDLLTKLVTRGGEEHKSWEIPHRRSKLDLGGHLDRRGCPNHNT